MAILETLQRIDISIVVGLIARAMAVVIADVEGFVTRRSGGKTIFGCTRICSIDATQKVGLRKELRFGEGYGILVLYLDLWSLGSA